MKRGSKILLGITVIVLAAASAFGIRAALMRSAADRTATSETPGGKQLFHCGMHPQVIQDHPGDCPICHMALTPMGNSSSTASADRKPLYWWDPMLGAGSISDHPGKSAMGMDLVPVYSESAGPDVKIDPTVVQNMGVRTAAVTKGPLGRAVRAVGLLSLPEPALRDVSLRTNGWIDKLYANQDGMHVTKGEPLFEFYSPDVQVASQELISAERARRSLPASASEAIKQQSQSLASSARRKLKLWDIDDRDIDAIVQASEPPRDVPFRSPLTGHVEEKMVVEGSSVQAGMKLLRIADHSKLWLELQVYGADLPFVKVGQQVTAAVEGVPGKLFPGTITFAYPHLDHMSRTLKFRATLDNSAFELRPGMFATAEIETAPLPDAVLCPREAIIDTGARQIAFVSDGAGHFSPRRVTVGVSGKDLVQVVSGLAPGELVVTSGQFLMDVESRTIEATQKLNDSNEPDRPAMPAPTPATAPAFEMPMAMGTTVPSTVPATNPTTTPATVEQPTTAAKPAELPRTLTHVYCPMAKADWLQVGDKVENPYMGAMMLTCGEVKKPISVPPGSALSPLLDNYLLAAKALDSDRINRDAQRAVAASADGLPSSRYQSLRDAASKLGGSTDVKGSREALKAVSQELLSALEKGHQ